MCDQSAHDVRTSITHSPGLGGSGVVVACGALAGELRAVLDQLGAADAVEVRYLPAPLHNRPDQIVPALSGELDAIGDGERVLVGYADCGTGGELDRYLAQLTAGGRHGVAFAPVHHAAGQLKLDRIGAVPKLLDHDHFVLGRQGDNIDPIDRIERIVGDLGTGTRGALAGRLQGEDFVIADHLGAKHRPRLQGA